MTVRLPVIDKYAVPSADIPCAENVRWCKAVCCSLVVHLSEQDVAEGVVARDPAHPELLAHDGARCVHLGESGCAVYEHRPAPCRSFDCREDKRIWRDYERRIPNPNLDKLAEASANWRRR